MTDYKCKDDKECLATIKDMMNRLGDTPKAGFNREKPKFPSKSISDLHGTFPVQRTDNYDVKNIIKLLVDDSKFNGSKSDYGKTIVCAYARIDGWSVGIVANQRQVVKTKKGEMQFGV